MESFKKGHQQNTYDLLGDKEAYERVKTSQNWKCWLLRCTLVAVGVIGAAFLFVFISITIHKDKDRPNEHRNTHQSSTAPQTQRPEVVKGPPPGLDKSQTDQMKNGGSHGQWVAPDFCPKGSFANGFIIKYHINMESGGDDTALIGISLKCAYKNGVRIKRHSRVESAAGHKGHWTGEVFCRKIKHNPFFLQRFALKVQTETESEDNTMVNTLRFSCGDLRGTKHHKQLESHVSGVKGRYGQWSETCPKESAICGLQARIQVHIPNGDNTALNDVRFLCCNYA